MRIPIPALSLGSNPASTARRAGRCMTGASGRGAMTKIGEYFSDRLDVVPAPLPVLVTRRPKYACRRCSDAVVPTHPQSRIEELMP